MKGAEHHCVRMQSPNHNETPFNILEDGYNKNDR